MCGIKYINYYTIHFLFVKYYTSHIIYKERNYNTHTTVWANTEEITLS